ncbi:sigma E protease regulator RseP [Arsenophonus symbiont of Ornithomya chloropus]|uniref:sigma E protease regulator RseP n=1 Tax=Arsenophonus symbiont of Ornithomya chloropus TaxID=634121 RepID=UPI0032B1E888
MGFFFTLFAFVIALGVMIIVHEFGHFCVARFYGIYIERFSIGFGKTIWRRVDRYGTEFVVAMIPLGGYVKMLDKEIISTAENKNNVYSAFNNKTVMERFAVVSAGPIANFLLAIFAYWLVYMIGVPSVRPVISDIQSNSIAAQANISAGMEIKSIDNIKTPDWNTVRMALISKIGKKKLNIQVLPIGYVDPIKKVINLNNWHFDPEKEDPVLSLGMMPVSAKQEPIIRNIKPGSAAELSGLKIGDKIIKVNEQVLDVWHPLIYFIEKSPNIPLLLTIEREGKNRELTLIPTVKEIIKKQKVGFAGFELSLVPLLNDYKIIQQYGLFGALYQAINNTWQLIQITVNMIGKLFTGDIKLTNLSGPISIAKGAGFSAESGLVYYLMFIALISINLGIINLCPLPVLDGGHLLFLIIEKIKGEPVSERIQDLSYRVGTVLLILLMGISLFNDFSRL